jgi:hypothetical protein
LFDAIEDPPPERRVGELDEDRQDNVELGGREWPAREIGLLEAQLDAA